MDNDDKQVGKILTRREAIRLLGVTGLTFLIGCGPEADEPSGATANGEAATATTPATLAAVAAEAMATATSAAIVPSCVVRPEATEGPYYVDVNLMRQDITEGKAGTPLALTFNVVQVGADGCLPLEKALVEIWHCDKDGAYSGVRDRSFDTSGQTWLRGAQMTDANGNATFNTIYPGWYPGRCVHIHFKVFPAEGQVFTSQLFFPDVFNNQVLTQAPYEKGVPDRSNGRDNIFRESLMAAPAMVGAKVEATFALGIDLSSVGSG